MSILWPITCEHISLRLGPRGIIHASVEPPLGAWRDGGNKGAPVRTVCGSDAYPVIHGVAGDPTSGVVAPWPPPKRDRCTDCERILAARLPSAGADHWRNLINIDPLETPRRISRAKRSAA